MQAVKKPSGVFLCSSGKRGFSRIYADDMATALFTYAKETELEAGDEITVIQAAEIQNFILTEDPEEEKAAPSGA